MRYWNRVGDLSNIVSKWKTESKDIPPETCPLIDEVIEALNTPNATPEMIKAIEIMETIRKHNSTLRELGHDWYEYSNQVVDEGEKIIEEIEKEFSNTEEELETAKKTIEELQSEYNLV